MDFSMALQYKKMDKYNLSYLIFYVKYICSIG